MGLLTKNLTCTRVGARMLICTLNTRQGYWSWTWYMGGWVFEKMTWCDGTTLGNMV